MPAGGGHDDEPDVVVIDADTPDWKHDNTEKKQQRNEQWRNAHAGVNTGSVNGGGAAARGGGGGSGSGGGKASSLMASLRVASMNPVRGVQAFTSASRNGQDGAAHGENGEGPQNGDNGNGNGLLGGPAAQLPYFAKHARERERAMRLAKPKKAGANGKPGLAPAMPVVALTKGGVAVHGVGAAAANGNAAGVMAPTTATAAATAAAAGASNGDAERSVDLNAEMKNLLEGLAMGQAAEMNDAYGDNRGPSEALPPPRALCVNLLKHQRVALSWMLKREAPQSMPCGGILADDQGLGKTVTTLALIVSAPKWKSEHLGVSVTTGPNGRMIVAPRTPQPAASPAQPTMTTTTSSSAPTQPLYQSTPKGMVRGGTLVVCPTAVLYQWEGEIRDKVAPQLGISVLIHHGPLRPRSAEVLAKNYDIVLTTYALVAMEAAVERDQDASGDATNGGGGGKSTSGSTSATKGGALGNVHWWRVILDEAQSMKNSRTRIACSCSALVAERRWCLTGTPMQNSIDDMYSYFRFLKYAPYENYTSFRSMISQPVERGVTAGWQRLRTILRSMMLRRTKTSTINGEPLVKLPPRIIKTQRLKLSECEEKEYVSLMTKFKKQFETFKEEGSLSKNYVSILWMLLRLRQACNHPRLPTMRSANGGLAGEGNATHDEVQAAKRIPEQTRVMLLNKSEDVVNLNLCPVCGDIPEDAVVSVCGHFFCQLCATEKIPEKNASESFVCKLCKMNLTADDVHTPAALRASLSSDAGGRAGQCKPARKRPETSTKIAAVLSKLREIYPYKADPNNGEADRKRQKKNGGFKSSRGSSDAAMAKALPPLAPPPPNPNHVLSSGSKEKVIIFSQWTAMLDLLEAPLEHEGYKFRRLDGTMSVAVRQQALRDFAENPDISVMLMSLKAASLGLNMVCACHVLLLDLWWCPTTEDQAIDRCHRIGQKRTVRVTRFIVEGSVEERILEIQEKKRELVASAFEWNEGAQAAVDLSMKDLVSLFTATRE